MKLWKEVIVWLFIIGWQLISAVIVDWLLPGTSVAKTVSFIILAVVLPSIVLFIWIKWNIITQIFSPSFSK